MSKAADAFRTISEIADELGVPKHVLRFWELKFPQLKPMKRGGGRRYYRPEDLELLRGIRHLLHQDGYTIKGVQKILREQGIDVAKAAGTRSGSKQTSALPATKQGTTTSKHGVKSAGRPSAKAQGSRKKPARAMQANSSVKTTKLIERLITELEACRGELRAQTVITKTTRKPAAKTTRVARAR